MKTLLFSICLFLCLGSFAKGSGGSYFIEGTAYSANNNILKNALLNVSHNGKNVSYMTDKDGRFKFEIKWLYPCKSGVPKAQWKSLTKKYNAEWIYVNFKCQGTRIKNLWEKYRRMNLPSSSQNGINLDLHFQN